MGTPRSQVVTGLGPPSVCEICRQPFRPVAVTCGGGKRKGAGKGMCPRCTRVTKLAKRQRKKED